MRITVRSGRTLILALAVVGSVLIGVAEAPTARAATTPVLLGAAANFAVLAGTTVTNTGSTTITGDLGLSPGTSVTGFPPGQVSGTQHVADTTAAQAENDLTAAYNDAAARSSTATIPVELGATTQTSGVYDSPAGTFGITGALTLDAQGDPNAVFIFKAASTLITASASTVNLVNGAQACNVFWQVGSSATIGTGSILQGNILALTSITVTTGVTMNGRALARNGAVTLDTNNITAANCATPQLSITTPGSVNLGVAPPGGTITAQLGSVTVSDTGYASWTATVTATNFTTGNGAPAETIANSNVSYWSGPATTQTGTATLTPGQATAAQAQLLDASGTAFSQQSGGITTSVTWNPTLIISVPAPAVAGNYTGVVTHSVA